VEADEDAKRQDKRSETKKLHDDEALVAAKTRQVCVCVRARARVSTRVVRVYA